MPVRPYDTVAVMPALMRINVCFKACAILAANLGCSHLFLLIVCVLTCCRIQRAKSYPTMILLMFQRASVHQRPKFISLQVRHSTHNTCKYIELCESLYILLGNLKIETYANMQGYTVYKVKQNALKSVLGMTTFLQHSLNSLRQAFLSFL